MARSSVCSDHGGRPRARMKRSNPRLAAPNSRVKLRHERSISNASCLAVSILVGDMLRPNPQIPCPSAICSCVDYPASLDRVCGATKHVETCSSCGVLRTRQVPRSLTAARLSTSYARAPQECDITDARRLDIVHVLSAFSQPPVIVLAVEVKRPQWVETVSSREICRCTGNYPMMLHRAHRCRMEQDAECQSSDICRAEYSDKYIVRNPSKCDAYGESGI